MQRIDAKEGESIRIAGHTIAIAWSRYGKFIGFVDNAFEDTPGQLQTTAGTVRRQLERRQHGKLDKKV